MAGKERESVTAGVDDARLQQALEDIEYSGRQMGPILGRIIAGIAIIWSLYQILLASPLPVAADLVNIKRPIFLAFAFLMCFLMFPVTKQLGKGRIPVYDIVTAVVAAGCAMYLAVMHEELSLRPGRMLSMDVFGMSIPYELLIGAFGVLLLLEATRRSIGLPLVIVALTFLVFTRFGQDLSNVLYVLGGIFLALGAMQLLRQRMIGAAVLLMLGAVIVFHAATTEAPLVQISHKGRGFDSLINYMWYEKEAIFGIPIDVAVSFVFLFVLFGALLDKAGAGRYFLDLAFAMVGRFRGGPAKAAILASGMTGSISGSSIANVVTTGTFTIPVMKRTGFPAIKAGAIEVAASTNGQIMPPVMGAAAFVMAEFIGISYFDVIVAAVIPAVLSYIALFYISHLEALKLGLKGMPDEDVPPLKSTFLSGVHYIVPIFILVYLLIIERLTAGSAVFWCILWMMLTMLMEHAFAENVNLRDRLLSYVAPLVLFLVLVSLMAAGVFTEADGTETMRVAEAVGWSLILGVVVLVARFIQRFRLEDGEKTTADLKKGLAAITSGLVAGARNMVGIGIAIATAGIIVGAVAASGLSSNLSGLVQGIAGGNIAILLLMTAVLALVLGMGLPTTANYIVVAGILAPVLVEVGGAAGYAMPLIAVHLFVFYYGLMADSTPPVCLAAFAASAISRADPLRTGVQSFMYDIRTAVLPMVFIFNTELLLIGVDSWTVGVTVFLVSLLAIFAFSSLTQGYFLTRVRWYEGVMLAAVCLMLFRPELFMDQIYPDWKKADIEKFVAGELDIPEGRIVRFQVTQETGYGDRYRMYRLEAPPPDQSIEDGYGLVLERDERDPDRYAATVRFGTPAAEAGMTSFQDYVTGIQVEQVGAPSKRWVYPFGFLLIGLLVISQLVRIRREKSTAGSPAGGG
ncbi:MAG: TRAP transporter fused permease subunit [Gammaproteobacteria bacterium]|nr:TRAP transporter fused permease subunit [Gammaproteobacteria bacterium]